MDDDYEPIKVIFYIVVGTGLLIVVGVWPNIPAETREILQIMAANGPFTALLIWFVVLLFGWPALRAFTKPGEQTSSPKQAFVITFPFGLLCAYVDYRLITPIRPYELWMPLIGTLFMIAWLFLIGAFSLERSSEDSVKAFMIGAPVGFLITAGLLLLLG